MDYRPTRLFEVVGKDGKKRFFDYKTPAKAFRNSPEAAKGATVKYGPDHEQHPSNRREAGWNKGKHPKQGWQGKKVSQTMRKGGHA